VALGFPADSAGGFSDRNRRVFLEDWPKSIEENLIPVVGCFEFSRCFDNLGKFKTAHYLNSGAID